MKNKDYFFWVLIGGFLTYRILRKPVTKAVWSLYTGPGFHANLEATVRRNDPAEIQHLHESYETWPVDVKSQFNWTLHKLNLKRPW